MLTCLTQLDIVILMNTTTIAVLLVYLLGVVFARCIMIGSYFRDYRQALSFDHSFNEFPRLWAEDFDDMWSKLNLSRRQSSRILWMYSAFSWLCLVIAIMEGKNTRFALFLPALPKKEDAKKQVDQMFSRKPDQEICK